MDFSKNDINIIESMIRNGATAGEIAVKANEIAERIKAEEEAKKKVAEAEKQKSAKRDAARTRLIEAVIQYAIDFGWVDKTEVLDKDIKALDEALRAEERVLDNVKEFGEKLFQGGTVSSDLSSDLDDVFERLMDSLMGEAYTKDTKKDSCKCGADKKCDCSSGKSLIDEISELLKQ